MDLRVVVIRSVVYIYIYLFVDFRPGLSNACICSFHKSVNAFHGAAKQPNVI